MAIRRLRNRNQIAPQRAADRQTEHDSDPLEPSKPELPTVDRIYATALKMLAARSRSEADLRDRLLDKYSGQTNEVDDCIARLKETGLVDDARFAENYAAYRTGTKAIGPSRLAQELASRKVPKPIVQDTVSALYDRDRQEELIDKAIKKRLRTRGHGKDAGATRRLMQHLARLGFKSDLIIRKVRALNESAGLGSDYDE